MPVIFDEVVTEIEPSVKSGAGSSVAQPEAEAGQAATTDSELARQITRLQERNQRLMAD